MTTPPDIVAEIKAALRSAESADEIEQVSDKYREAVRALHDDPDRRVFAIQIINIKDRCLAVLETGD